MPPQGRSAIHVRTTCQKRLVAHLDRTKRYPENGNHRSVELIAAFTLYPFGHVLAASVMQRSGAGELDDRR